MSNIILPDGNDSNKEITKAPINMGDVYNDPKVMPPKLASEHRAKEIQGNNPNNYGGSQIAFAPDAWMKTAQSTPGVNNIMTQPMWFSPLHTAQNWQVASRRREIIQWARFFFENEAKVAAAIQFYCFTPDTQILMSDGSQKAISSLRVGNLVRSHDGTSNKVVRKFARESEEEIVLIYISGVSGPLKCSKEHKIYIHRNGINKYVKASELEKNDYLLTPTLYEENNKKHLSVDSNLAWLVGVYAAEGCGIPYESKIDGKLENHFKGVYFTLAYSEKDTFAVEISKKIEQYYGIKCKIHADTEQGITRVCAYGRNIADDLHGLCPGTSKYGSKRLLPCVLSWGRESLKQLLGGFLSGDGCFNINNGIQGVGVSKILCEQIANICDRLGLLYSFSRIQKDKNRQTLYNIRISKCSCRSLKDVCFKIDPKLELQEKKLGYNPYFKIEGFIARRIRKIKTKLYKGELYDIEVENSHSYVANRVAVSNSQFPLNSFKLECKSRKVLKFFEHKVLKPLQLVEKLKMMAFEYFMIGDVFTHLDIDCPTCQGKGVDPETNEPCNHPGGLIKKIVILNPDWVEVQQSPLSDEPVMVLIPDEELKRIVFYKQPKAIYDRIPDEIKILVLQGKPIPLSSRTTSHLKHLPSPYGTYGTSLIRRLFTILAYKTKIMTANWIVAERLILPVRVIKIGSDNRPASQIDIVDVQQQIAATVNDPNLTLITHHNFEYDYIGASGKILQVTQELEYVGKEILDGFMLNQSLLNGEMVAYCHSEDTLTLTDSGYKKYDEITELDKIACYNPETKSLEYHPYIHKHVYNQDGEMIHFNTDKIDILVTPNHRMYSKKRDGKNFEFTLAKNIKNRAKFIGTVNNFIPENQNKTIKIGLQEYSMEDYCKLAGYYVSEGSLAKEYRKNRSTYNKKVTVNIHQTAKGKGYEDITLMFDKIFNNHYKTDNTFSTYNPNLAQHFELYYGNKSLAKRLPPFIKNLDQSYLEILIKAMVNGDGYTTNQYKNTNIYYDTTNLQLALDFAEIAFKCGYVTKISKRSNIKNNKKKYYNKDGHEIISKLDTYLVHISKGLKGIEPALENKKNNFKSTINRVNYKGKVYCFTVPYGLFVTMRNGLTTIQGNSSAQVGVETLIRRLEIVRKTFELWVEEKLFKPIAQMQGFIDEEESEEIGETVYLYPQLKWEDLQLKDKNQYYQILSMLHDKQLVSDQTILEELGLNYDQEIKRKRYESTQVGPAGGGLGAQGGAAAGGALGGMGMGAEGGAGGVPGASGAGGPEIGGAAGGLGGDMAGGAPAAGGMGPMASGTKIMKKGKSGGGDNEQEPVPMVKVNLTKIEQKMAGALLELSEIMGIRKDLIRFQYPVQNPKGGTPYHFDFALPSIKLGIEADGEIAHDSPKQLAHDKERDSLLAKRGWTVLRFKDRVVEDAIQEVKKTIADFIQKLSSKNKKAEGEIKLYMIKNASLADVTNTHINKYYGE